MNSRILNIIGLCFGMLGVFILFFWANPQPTHIQGIAIILEDNTPIDNTGKTVAEYNQETEKKELTFKYLSKIGLSSIFFGFTLQLVAILIPEKKIMKSRKKTKKRKLPAANKR